MVNNRHFIIVLNNCRALTDCVVNTMTGNQVYIKVRDKDNKVLKIEIVAFDKREVTANAYVGDKSI